MSIQNMSAATARNLIVDLADEYSWETIARAMILAMSGDDARQHLQWLADEGFQLDGCG